MSIGHPDHIPGEISPDEPVVLPLREVIAAASVVARIRDLLLGADAEVGAAIAQKLTNLGAPASDNHLPAKGKIPATPQVLNGDSAWEYLDALYKNLVESKPWGGLDPTRPLT